MIILTAIAISFLTLTGIPPADSLSLQYCYEQAYENYPTAKNIALQKKITDLNVKIANSGYFPDVSISGKGSYQSEVTSFSTPGGEGPPPVSKDQYEASLGVTQNIFSGGAVGIGKDLERAIGEQEINSTRVDLHAIRSQVDQVYYGILLSQQQAKSIDLLIDNLKEQLSTIRSRVENGVLLPSQQRILEAELIKARQDSATTQSTTKAGYRVLSEIIGEQIPSGSKLTLPQPPVSYQSLQPQRPEYDSFESTRKVLNKQEELSGAGKWPRISAFGTASYGRPGLNFLNDDFHDYYIAGLQLQWNLTDFSNADREQQALKIQRQKVTQQQQAFTRQLNASLDRISERIVSLKENIKRDREIIDIREQIVKETSSQLKYGVITATEYVTELTEANQARLSYFLNKVQLAQAQTDYATTLGIKLEDQ